MTVTTEVASHAGKRSQYGMRGVIASEWTKLWTVRSTKWTIAVTIVLVIGLSALACSETRSHWSQMNFVQRVTFDPTGTSLIGFFFAQFAIGVLGVLVMSAEYGTGTIRATLAASPRRNLVLISKCAVFGLVALVISEICSFGAFFLGQALLSAPATHASLGDPGTLRAVIGSGLYVCVLGLFALGIATMIRHSAGAISIFVGIVLVLPLIIAALPSSIGTPIRRYLPARIGDSLISTGIGSGPNSFAPWTGFAVLCGYAAAALVVGGILLNRRDA